MRYIITTVGTSAIEKSKISTGNFKDQNYDYFDNLLQDLNCKKEELSEYFNQYDISKGKQLKNLSAEIKSLVKLKCDRDCYNYLILTDTAECRLCGEFLKEYLSQKFNSQSETIRIKGLQVDSSSTFQREGLKEMGRVMGNILNTLKGQEVLLNLTGGFKAAIPYLSLFGMLHKIPIYYIFEEEDELIEIPPVPIEYDVEAVRSLTEYFIKIESDTGVKATEIEYALSNENRIFFQKEGDEYTTSFFGDIFWKKYKEEYEPEVDSLPKTKINPQEKPIKFYTKEPLKERLNMIAKKMIASPYVKEIIGSCNFEPNRRHSKVIPLTGEDYKRHKQTSKEGVCIVIDDKSDAGYAMLVQTTGRIFWETKKIAEILKECY